MSCSLRVERLTSRAPSRASSRAISLLTADGVMPQQRAAAEKLPRSTTRTNTSISPERLISSRAICEFISQMNVPGARLFRAAQRTDLGAGPTTRIETGTVMPLALYALTAGAFGIGVTEFVIMGLLLEVSADLGVSISAAGLLISGYALGVVVGAPLLTAPSPAAGRARRVLLA